MLSKLSIIIPCRNEEKYIENCINSILINDYPSENYEIIIVDGKSSDKTIEIIEGLQKKHENIRHIDNPQKVTPVALNLGIRNANYEYIMIAGAHSSFPENYISVLMKNIVDLKADGIGGMLSTTSINSTAKTSSIIKVLSNKFGVGNSMFRIGVTKPTLVDTVPFGIYKKVLFENVSFYDERLIRNHDIALSKEFIQKRKKIYLLPDVRCNYYARESFKKLARNNYSNGYWNLLTVYITKKYYSLSIRHFIPLAFILSLIVPIFPAIFISKYFALLPLFVLVLYIILIFRTSYSLLDKSNKLTLLVGSFYTLHFSYGVGSLIGLFRIDKLFFNENRKTKIKKQNRKLCK